MSAARSTRTGRGEGRLASPFFPCLTVGLTLVTLFAFLHAGVAGLLQYDRPAIANGEVWRWLLGHLTHWSADQLFWDLATFFALGVACERRSCGRFAATIALSATAIPAALWWAQPDLELYRGLSGVDSALFALLVVTVVTDELRAGRRFLPAVAALFAAAFALKVGIEAWTGETVFVAARSAGFSVVPLAHVVGAAVGGLAAVSRPRPRAPTHPRADREMPRTSAPCACPKPPPQPSSAEVLSGIARQYVLTLNRASRRAPSPTRLRAFVRILERARQCVVRHVRQILQEHWDVVVFDLAFGSLKAFGVYPALYLMGLAWMIPLAEYAPLNTQLWTAGYLFGRRELLSQLGKRRYGHTLNAMDAFRDRALGTHPRDARRIHHFWYAGQSWTVRIRSHRFVDWLRRARGLARERNVLLPAELRGMISNREFLFQANDLRNNPYLYEEVAIWKILTVPEDRPKLLGALVPENPAPVSGEGRLVREMGEARAPVNARVIEIGDSSAASVRRHLGSFSATSLALRFLGWAHQRATYRQLAELDSLEYRLLADLLDAEWSSAREGMSAIRCKQRQIDTSISLLERFAEQARRVRSKAQGLWLLRCWIPEARSAGLRVRLAQLAYALGQGANALTHARLAWPL